MATEFQEKVYNALSCIGCTRIGIQRDEKSGQFSIKYQHGWKALVYTVLHLNFLLKFSFVILLSVGSFEPVTEFFDWIAILEWYLIISMIFTSERLFVKIYPFFEILCAGWRIQNELYVKLNKDEDFKAELRTVVKSRVNLQM
jgi:hypothetical protein